ncbi:hypothetical protein V6N11_084372 [Hibiscus sabdariffa]|uniref:Uncharacterized protein n=2 Tax=Hibiscus sabdariffa TaxID=183260 RepID=A0ABR2CA47_9ROSI
MMAWSIGVSRFIVEIDSVDALNVIRRYKEGKVTFSLVPCIVSIINRAWSKEFTHILCEGNKLADCMAKFVNFDDFLCRHFLAPPKAVEMQYEEDRYDEAMKGD